MLDKKLETKSASGSKQGDYFDPVMRLYDLDNGEL